MHVIAPEQGYTLPGMTIVCGESHTATHGAFGCLAFGIWYLEVKKNLCISYSMPTTKHYDQNNKSSFS